MIGQKHENDVDRLLRQVLPQDLVKFGLFPELVGGVPVNGAFQLRDKEALIAILTEPKNALVRQYQKILELYGVELILDNDALA